MLRFAPLIAITVLLAGCIKTVQIDAHGNSAEFRAMVSRAAMSAGVPDQTAQAVVRHESGYNPRMRGRAGEYGLGQIKCATARGVGFSGPCSALLDPETNLTYSMRYLKLAIEKGGNGCAGVSLYQLGVAARARCTGYGRAVHRRME